MQLFCQVVLLNGGSQILQPGEEYIKLFTLKKEGRRSTDLHLMVPNLNLSSIITMIVTGTC